MVKYLLYFKKKEKHIPTFKGVLLGNIIYIINVLLLLIDRITVCLD